MPATSASAPGKIILFGEHAVVYGRPAIAAPVTQVKARVIITANPTAPPGKVHIQASGIGLDADLSDLSLEQPQAAAIRAWMQAVGLSRLPACTIRITSSIPVAAGLGSGAAVSVALLRALAGFLGQPIDRETLSSLAFQVERIHHGTPSGIDNTVITYEQPVYFVRSQPIVMLQAGAPFTIVIGDTGISSPTVVTVGDVANAWRIDPAAHEKVFDQIGGLANQARLVIESGKIETLGPLMNENHQLLIRLGVSSPQLDHLVAAAIEVGAWGAKLSGGGRGGNMIAVVDHEFAQKVSNALLEAGAVKTIITQVKPTIS